MASSSAVAADFEDQVRVAGEKIQAAMGDSEKLVNAGEVDAANAMLMKLFGPKPSAAETFILANVLFEIDRKASYALHQSAAAAEPQQAEVAYEWAIEQHRAGEYAGALKAYTQFSKADPNRAITYGLQADCLLRLGRIDDALAAWKKSEDAPDGSLEAFENMVCAVHREPVPYQQRAALLNRLTKGGDDATAIALIALDCQFPHDWWNVDPMPAYIEHDLTAVQAARKWPANDLRARSIACAAACATADTSGPADVKMILEKNALLIDPAHTLPVDGRLLSVILHAALASEAISEKTLREQFGEPIMATARKGSDVEYWNSALFTSPDPTRLLPREYEAWKATGDVRFAVGALTFESKSKAFGSSNPTLIAAIKQFPENGQVLRFAVAAARQDNTLSRPLLAAAAMAEFHHFTSFEAAATVVNRPRSDLLRAYFKLMDAVPTTQP